MRSYQPSSDRRRGVSLALTIAAHLLIVFLLLKLAPVLDPPKEPGRSLTVTMLPEGAESVTPTQQPRTPARAAAAKAARSESTKPPTPTPPPPRDADTPSPPPVTGFPGYIMLSKQDYAAADVGKIKGTAKASEGKALAGADGQGDGDADGSSAAAGVGPHGQQLYAAEWYRRPAQSQLSPYLPKNVPPGAWAEVACRTIPNFGVTDCVQLGDSQPGSGLARAIREAAWQFKVRPPRIGGKSQVGTWVRIHIDFTDKPGVD